MHLDDLLQCLPSAYTRRHDHVQHNEIEGLYFYTRNGFFSAGGRLNPIAQFGQQVGCNFSLMGFIINNENALPRAFQGLRGIRCGGMEYFRFCRGKKNLHYRFAITAADINPSAMILNGIPDHRQTQTRPTSPHHFAGIKGFKNAFHVLWGNTLAGIGYRQQHMALRAIGAGWLRRTICRSDGDRSLAFDRLDGIHDKVDQNFLNVRCRTLDHIQTGLQVRLKFYIRKIVFKPSVFR